MQPAELINEARLRGRTFLGEADGKRLLSTFGVPVPEFAVAPRAADAETVVDGMAGPFAVKVISQDILHKSDVGGVLLDVQGAAGVRAAIESIAERPAVRAARIDGFLIERMCDPGVELVIGSIRDPQFGPMIMIGLGGLFVEVLRDVAFRVCPIDRPTAIDMLEQLRGAKVLDGVRGRPAVDRDAIVDLLVKVGGRDGVLMSLADEVAELDLNPVIATSAGVQVADVRVILAPDKESLRPAADGDARDVLARFERLFAPRTIAVVGASASGSGIANTFIKRLGDFGYDGSIFPIHPKAETIEGLPCHPSLAATPEPVDYAYIAVGARQIPDLLRSARNRLRFAQVISSGFGEITEGLALQADLVAAARESGCRVLGPNCLGLYSPRGRVTFSADAPTEMGVVGVVSQSGGLGTDIIKRGQWRGLRFSGLVTVGNSADLGPVDLLEFYLADPQTRVVGLYLEDVKDGRGFFELLRGPLAVKPVVVLRGGRTPQGRAAAASHTGALASDASAWEAVARQTGCVLVKTVDAFIDALLAFQCLELRSAAPTQHVVLFGNGGGTGVLAADAFAERGLTVAALGSAAIERLEALKLPPGTSVVNPIDTPVATLQAEGGKIAGRILDIVYEYAQLDALILHVNLAAFVGRSGGDPIEALIEAAVDSRRRRARGPHFVIVLRTDGSPELEERRRRYRAAVQAAGIPVYDELEPAAEALAAVRWVEQRAPRSARASAAAGTRELG